MKNSPWDSDKVDRGGGAANLSVWSTAGPPTGRLSLGSCGSAAFRSPERRLSYPEAARKVIHPAQISEGPTSRASPTRHIHPGAPS